LCAAGFLLLNHGFSEAAPSLRAFMPRPEDFTLLWWANGPQFYLGIKTPPPEPILCLQSGAIGFSIDTSSLRILHAGRFTKPVAMQDVLKDNNSKLSTLPPIQLELKVLSGNHSFTCTGRGAISKDEFYSPVRFVDSGHFFQRVAIEGLEFADEKNQRLAVKGWLEISLWPDRLTLSFGLEKYPDGLEMLQMVAEGTCVSVPTASKKAAVLELFGPGNRLDPVVETSSGLEISRDAQAGCTTLKIPALPWKNTRGTYYSQDELDRLDRWRFRVRNDTAREAVLPIMFVDEHPPAITGFTPLLCDVDGVPTGIPVQISKNWHRREDKGNLPHQGPWFHGCTWVHVPAHSKREFVFALTYARYGGVPAVSHAQLCLIGWGHNQFWDQSAIGSFGESICYEPGRVQRRCFIDDVRPLMTLPNPEDKPYGWAANCGGGDFLMWIGEKGDYQGFRATRTDYRAYGPCLTDVCYIEQTSGGEIDSRVNVSIARSDDYLRAFHHLRYDVRQPIKWQRLAFYQLGSDFYNATAANLVAIGSSKGLIEEWRPIQGKDIFDRRAVPLAGTVPWISIHGVERSTAKQGEALASRGLIIRSWKAVLGGKVCSMPYASFYATEWGKGNFRTVIELSPPSDVLALERGDFLEADLELVVFPSDARAYYGPNESFRQELEKEADTWRPVQREATGTSMHWQLQHGKLERETPLAFSVDWRGRAGLTLTGGVGYVPVTFMGLKNNRDFELLVEGKPLNQSVHGNDFWQTDYDEIRREWRVTYNILRDGRGPTRLEFRTTGNFLFGK
jgi:hypothetical protein